VIAPPWLRLNPARRAAAPPPAGSRLLSRIAEVARPFRWHLAALVAVDLLVVPIVLLTPVPLKIAVDSVVGAQPVPGLLDAVLPDALTRNDTRVLALAAVLQVLAVLLAQLQALVSYVLRAQVGERVTLQFRTVLFSQAQRLSIAYHDMKGTSDSLYRIQHDATSVRTVVVDGLIPAATAIVTLGAAVTVTARLDPQLALVAIAIAPPLLLLNSAYRIRVRPRYRNVKRMESSALGVVQEALGAVRVVKAFGREDREEQRFRDRSDETVRQRIRLAVTEGTFGLVVNIITALGTAVVLFIGVRNVQAGVLSLGELLMVMSYLAQMYSPLKTISKKAASLQSSFASAERAFELLDELPDVPERADALPLRRALGAIDLRRVSFAYDGEHHVLHEVSLHVDPGTRVGIYGRTGAGKTTLVHLVARFHDATDGEVLLDGNPIANYTLEDLRAQFAIVLQEPVLFSTSIAENIAYAREGATFDDIVTAAKAANAHDFVTLLPHGYDTVVGERGMRLSGGERQRISLARAFLKDAPILILDEPTSSVDVHTEKSIKDAMGRLMTGRTALMVAHRLGTLDICDARVELDAGRVVTVAGRGVKADTPRGGPAESRQGSW
jgi:ATP-binding cassette, subfamily B, bacterial